MIADGEELREREKERERARCDINETCPGGESEPKNTNPVYFEMCDRHNIVLSTGGCMYLICFSFFSFFFGTE